jgi:hypothetical protein
MCVRPAGSAYANEFCKAANTLSMADRMADVRATVEKVKGAASVLVIGGGLVRNHPRDWCT